MGEEMDRGVMFKKLFWTMQWSSSKRCLPLPRAPIPVCRKTMTAGGPQGSALGCFIFLILINFAGRIPLPEPLGQKITAPINKRKPINKTQCKFIDDMTLANSLDLKENLFSLKTNQNS